MKKWVFMINGKTLFLNGKYRVRHMSWYGVSNGCGTKMAQARLIKFSTAIYHSVWQLFLKI